MSDSSLGALAAVAARWSVDDATSAEVIRVACDALVAGVNSPSLGELAGVSFVDTTHEVEDLLPRVLDELGIPFYERGSPAGQVAAARVLAHQCLAGETTPREFVAWAHRTFRHGQNDTVEPLLRLDDEYGILEYTNRTIEQVDRDARAAAEHLANTS